MFILDDLLISPLVFIARKVQEAAQQDAASQKQSITTQLTELYRLLESGEIDEAEFDRQEAALLDLLDEIRWAPQADDNDDRELEQPEVVSEVGGRVSRRWEGPLTRLVHGPHKPEPQARDADQVPSLARRVSVPHRA